MTAADNFQQSEGRHDQVSPEPTPVDERLESALGGALTRFLLSALGSDHGPSRDEPR